MHQDATWYRGRPQPRQLCVRWGPSPLPQKGRSPTQFSAHVYCGQVAGWIQMPLGTEVGLSPGHIVVHGDQAHPQKAGLGPGDFVLDRVPKERSPSPIIGPFLLWSNGWMDQDATLYGGRPQPTRHCVRHGPSYPQKKGRTHPTQFLAHVYCGQVAGWMKTPLGTEVDLGPGHNCTKRGPMQLQRKGHSSPPLFGPCLLWPRSPISATAELLY